MRASASEVAFRHKPSESTAARRGWRQRGWKRPQADGSSPVAIHQQPRQLVSPGTRAHTHTNNLSNRVKVFVFFERSDK